jgi:S-methylmethionine-dependent homocysteine/selenocysteine methylase
MAKYRDSLPQMKGGLFLTDGGIETTLIFHEGIELPYFAAFDLLKDQSGQAALRRYYSSHASIARDSDCGFILESATWRASIDWGAKLGYRDADMAEVNRQAIALLVELRRTFETGRAPMVISGCVGPRGDGYRVENAMTAEAAQAYHAKQIDVFAGTAADMVTAITMTYVDEAIGVTKAAQAAGMPVVISFTVETDGRLPSGQSLKDAVQAVDAATGKGPAYYMINCAHPDHFEDALKAGEGWLKRIRGVRANASRLSHAELDEATELDAGNPVELGQQYRELRNLLPQIVVMGGCCGTDHRHIEAICHACTSAEAA